MKTPVRIQPKIKHYSWGQTGKDAWLPALQHQSAGDQPWAELWLGVHPEGEAEILSDNQNQPLSTQYPDLNALFKILTIREMLSIQLHPDAVTARTVFERELAANIPAEKRTYRDANAKPEMIIPLTEFYALAGFRKWSEIASQFNRYPSLARCFAKFSPDELPTDAEKRRQLVSCLFNLSQPEVQTLLDPLIGDLRHQHYGLPYKKSDPEFWMMAAHDRFCQNGRYDIGVLFFFILNLVILPPAIHIPGFNHLENSISGSSQGLYIRPGQLHAYLHGIGLEHMLNSDNVIRGGLTDKFMDIETLMAITDFDATDIHFLTPEIQKSSTAKTMRYQCPGQSFETHIWQCPAGRTTQIPGENHIHFWLMLAGQATLKTENGEFSMADGDIIMVPDQQSYTLETHSLCTAVRIQ